VPQRDAAVPRLAPRSLAHAVHGADAELVRGAGQQARDLAPPVTPAYADGAAEVAAVADPVLDEVPAKEEFGLGGRDCVLRHLRRKRIGQNLGLLGGDPPATSQKTAGAGRISAGDVTEKKKALLLLLLF
jgi:hypothetical protein